MNAGKLKELLKDVPDDMQVLIPLSNEFTGEFYSPCSEDSGSLEMGLIPDEEDEKEAELLGKKITDKSFVLVPCGFFEEKDHNHELN